jgi:hypothetical protein
VLITDVRAVGCFHRSATLSRSESFFCSVVVAVPVRSFAPSLVRHLVSKFRKCAASSLASTEPLGRMLRAVAQRCPDELDVGLQTCLGKQSKSGAQIGDAVTSWRVEMEPILAWLTGVLPSTRHLPPAAAGDGDAVDQDRADALSVSLALQHPSTAVRLTAVVQLRGIAATLADKHGAGFVTPPHRASPGGAAARVDKQRGSSSDVDDDSSSDDDDVDMADGGRDGDNGDVDGARSNWLFVRRSVCARLDDDNGGVVVEALTVADVLLGSDATALATPDAAARSRLSQRVNIGGQLFDQLTRLLDVWGGRMTSKVDGDARGIARSVVNSVLHLFMSSFTSVFGDLSSGAWTFRDRVAMLLLRFVPLDATSCRSVEGVVATSPVVASVHPLLARLPVVLSRVGKEKEKEKEKEKGKKSKKKDGDAAGSQPVAASAVVSALGLALWDDVSKNGRSSRALRVVAACVGDGPANKQTLVALGALLVAVVAATDSKAAPRPAAAGDDGKLAMWEAAASLLLRRWHVTSSQLAAASVGGAGGGVTSAVSAADADAVAVSLQSCLQHDGSVSPAGAVVERDVCSDGIAVLTAAAVAWLAVAEARMGPLDVPRGILLAAGDPIALGSCPSVDRVAALVSSLLLAFLGCSDAMLATVSRPLQQIIAGPVRAVLLKSMSFVGTAGPASPVVSLPAQLRAVALMVAVVDGAAQVR